VTVDLLYFQHHTWVELNSAYGKTFVINRSIYWKQFNTFCNHFL